MISKNISFNEPFLLVPALIERLWGGSRLKDCFAKETAAKTIAESWECSTHPDGLCYVGSGIFKGKSLKEVIEKYPEILGNKWRGLGDLPILVKFIDAEQDLSIQVHPNDDYAKVHENGSLGKYEMWYVLDAKENSKLIYGFHHEISKNILMAALSSGLLENYLQKIEVKKGNVFFVPPGLIHAIGSGIFLVEIQQNSNITYRLYDYNRKDQNGKKRDLHIDKALDVVSLSVPQEPNQRMKVLKFTQGCASESLCSCKYFCVDRLIINNLENSDSFITKCNEFSFEIFICIEGNGILEFNNNKVCFNKGNSIFFPANSSAKISGKAEFLKVVC